MNERPWNTILESTASNPKRRDALAQLWRIYRHPVCALFMRHGQGEGEANALAEEFFALIQLETIVPTETERMRFRTWLFERATQFIVERRPACERAPSNGRNPRALTSQVARPGATPELDRLRAFSGIVRRESASVRRVLSASGVPAETLDDASQEVFLEEIPALENISALDGALAAQARDPAPEYPPLTLGFAAADISPAADDALRARLGDALEKRAVGKAQVRGFLGRPRWWVAAAAVLAVAATIPLSVGPPLGRGAPLETLTTDLGLPTATFPLEPQIPAPSPAAPSAEPSVRLSELTGARPVAREIALLRHARGALDARDAAGALRALDEYARERRSGILDPEATVLRIRALVDLGDRTGAARLAKGFVAQHPNSAHAASLRSLAE